MIITRPAEPRTAIVTGAASGVGAALVARLQADDWLVVGLDLLMSSADIPLEVDIADPESVASAIQTAGSRTAVIDAVVNCAGVFPSTIDPTHLISSHAWDHVIAVNLTGPFLLARESLPYLCKRGGSLVFVASVAANAPTPGCSAYAASKSGVLGLMRSLALEYGRFGVRVNAVSPGWIDTPMAASVLRVKERRERIERRLLTGKVAAPAHIASLIHFLISPASCAITGAEIFADGGMQVRANVGETDVARFWERIAASGRLPV